MKYYIDRPKSSHKNVRKKNKHIRGVFKDHVVFSYLMAHLDYLRELNHPGCGLFAYNEYEHNSVKVRPVKVTQVTFTDPLYDDIWADDTLYRTFSNSVKVSLEMEVSRDALEFFREWLDFESKHDDRGEI